MKTLILTLIYCAYVGFVQAQINPNSLFLVINKNNPNFSEKTTSLGISQKTYTINKPTKVSFEYFSSEKDNRIARFVILLPKQMITDFAKRDRVIYVKNAEKKWKKMRPQQFSEKVVSYLHSYKTYFWSDKERIEERLYNVFIIKEEDLEKDYIPCYEVDVLVTKIIEE